VIPRNQTTSNPSRLLWETEQDASMMSDSRKTSDQTGHEGSKSFKPPLDPLRVLIACGWLTAAEAADQGVKIDTLTRAHQVVRVTALDGRAVIVKQPTPEARQSGRNLDRELYVYRLAGWIDALSKTLPAPLLIDEMRQLLVFESLALQRNWPSELEIEPISAPSVAKLLGQAMASWHRETKDIALEPSPAPGILHIADSIETALEGRSSSAQAFLRSLTADLEFCEALREGAEVYQPACLIHGDIRPDNWVVRRDRVPNTLKVIDWEMSGLGDPAWDIGSACAESILQVVRTEVSAIPDASGWPPLAASALREFLCGYAAVQGRIDASDSATWDRVALMAATRLLHVAGEWAEYPYNIDGGGVDQIVGQARNLLRTRQLVAASLASWAQS
jgi:Ser/Thr protein kinase RdoA (MazF antagonist)